MFNGMDKKMIEKIELGKTGLKVTEFGMGVLTIGWTGHNLPLNEGASIVRYALERGVNFLDTAEYYKTYKYINEALKGTNYEPIIVSKSLTSDYEAMKTAIENARIEMNRDVIDIFLLHEVREAPDLKNRAGALLALSEAKQKGRIKATGISTHHIDVTEDASDLDEIDVIFPLINFASLGIRNGKNQGSNLQMEEAIKKAHKNNKGIFAMKAFGGGPLIKDYVKALDYIRGIKEIDSVMLGFGSKNDVDVALKYFSGELPKDYVPDTDNKKMRIDIGDCEGCGRCIKACPNKAISISPGDSFAKINQDFCLTCGYCAPVCPVRAIVFL